MCLILECLRGRDDKKTERLLLSMFGHAGQLAAIKGEPSGNDVVERLVSIMAVGPPSVQSTLVDAHATLPAESLATRLSPLAVPVSRHEVFTLFSPYLTAKVNEKKKKRDPAYAKREAIIELLLRGGRGRDHNPERILCARRTSTRGGLTWRCGSAGPTLSRRLPYRGTPAPTRCSPSFSDSGSPRRGTTMS